MFLTEKRVDKKGGARISLHSLQLKPFMWYKTAKLESASGIETRPTKDIHNFKW